MWRWPLALLMAPGSCLAALAEGAPARPDAPGFLQWILSTLGIVLLLFAAAYLLRKSRFVQRRSGSMSILSQLQLGPKERLVEVRIRDRDLLVGVTAGGISLVCDLSPRPGDAAEFGRLLRGEAAVAPREPGTGDGEGAEDDKPGEEAHGKA
ncbi:MAG: flagellar biosynthetic protein FliO [Succinivibrionaceae bacterium]|nr:flagellar biosynthetic protein FliO [Succinivibrionaceae bacterium]